MKINPVDLSGACFQTNVFRHGLQPQWIKEKNYVREEVPGLSSYVMNLPPVGNMQGITLYQMFNEKLTEQSFYSIYMLQALFVLRF